VGTANTSACFVKTRAFPDSLYAIDLRQSLLDLVGDQHIVTRRPISRQRPKYMHATIEPVLQEVFSVCFTYIHC
jgi:hypothetical protein